VSWAPLNQMWCICGVWRVIGSPQSDVVHLRSVARHKLPSIKRGASAECFFTVLARHAGQPKGLETLGGAGG
jgi:hypothetical protein